MAARKTMELQVTERMTDERAERILREEFARAMSENGGDVLAAAQAARLKLVSLAYSEGYEDGRAACRLGKAT